MLSLCSSASLRQALAINWRDPIADRMVVAWTPTRPLINLATGRAFALTDTGADWKPNNNAAGAARAGSNYLLTSATDGAPSKTEFSFLAVCSLQANSGNTQSILSMGDGLGSNGNYVLVQIGDSGGVLTVQWNLWDSSYKQAISNAVTPAGPGSAHVMVGINSVSQSRCELYIDGTQNQTGNTTAITTGSANNLALTLFKNSSGAQSSLQGPANLILIWNRALSVDECARMSAQPLRIFATSPLRTPAYYPQASGAQRRPAFFIAT